MEVSLYQAAAGMNATEQWQELLSDNLAGASTPGNRKREISFSAVEAGLNSRASDPANPGFVIPIASSTINFEQGELHATGDSMDVALEGSGFFTVQTSDGQLAYTRNGEFQVNAQGQLTTTRGDPIMGDNGPILLSAGNSSPITISAAGEVSQGASKRGKLQITDFNKPGLLTSLGGSLYRADDADLQTIDSSNTHVRQGFTENANSSPVNEMSGLITAMRMFESNQKVLQMQSDRMSREISDLGNPS
jgi:flagellar basal body rod protein FlgG